MFLAFCRQKIRVEPVSSDFALTALFRPDQSAFADTGQVLDLLIDFSLFQQRQSQLKLFRAELGVCHL